MADLFISYASDDRSYVSALVEAFEAQGWTVWWDRYIETGTSFDRRIEEALDNASCIVVVWSESSIKSDWVRAEAAEGLQRNILVPVLLDNVKPPLLFRQKQAISVIDWKVGHSREPLSRLIPSIASILNSYKESRLPVSTQRSWVLGKIENLTGNFILDTVPRRLLDIGLRYFENLFLYAPLGTDVEALDTTQLRDLADDEGLDGHIYGEIAPLETNLELTLHIEAATQEPVSNSVVVQDHTQLPSRVAELLRDLASVLQGSDVPLGSDMVDYLSGLNTESIYQVGQAYEFEARHDFAGAARACRQATTIDEGFLPAYRAWAIFCLRLGQPAEARELIARGTRSLAGESARDSHAARGMYYAVHNEDYDKAATEYEALLRISPLDRSSLSRLAVCRFYQLDFDAARELSDRTLQLYPTDMVAKQNLAFYSLYAGAFDEADRRAGQIIAQDTAFTESIVIQALVSATRGDLDAADKVYNSHIGASEHGDSLLTHGLADLAMAQQMWVQADEWLDRGIALDEKSTNREWLAQKLLMKAEIALSNDSDAIAARQLMERSLETSTSTPGLAIHALLCLRFGIAELEPLAHQLKRKTNTHGRAYAKMVDGISAYQAGDLGESTRKLSEAMETSDLWLVRFCTSLIYMNIGLTLEAEDELKVCASRPGEAISAGLDELPTFRLYTNVQRHLESYS